jgi:hypothetical protein
MSQEDRSGGRPDRRGPRPGGSRRSGGRPNRAGSAPGGARARREDSGRRPDAERTSGQRLTPTSPRRPEPAIAEGVTGKELDRAVWTQLRTLSKENAEGVAQHLVMAALLLDTDLEAAQAHAETAVRRAGRVPAAREALGLVAYRQGDWAKALAEFRTVRPLSPGRAVSPGGAPARPSGPRAGARLDAGGADAGPRRAGRAGDRRLGDPPRPGPAGRRGRRSADPGARRGSAQAVERQTVLRLRGRAAGPRRPQGCPGVVRVRGGRRRDA